MREVLPHPSRKSCSTNFYFAMTIEVIYFGAMIAFLSVSSKFYIQKCYEIEYN